MFGINEKQYLIMSYLYKLKDSPESPPDPRRIVSLIAKNLAMTQQEVKRQIEGLEKRHYVRYVIAERKRHYDLTSIGIGEIEKHTEKKRTIEVSTEKIGVTTETREVT